MSTPPDPTPRRLSPRVIVYLILIVGIVALVAIGGPAVWPPQSTPAPGAAE